MEPLTSLIPSSDNIYKFSLSVGLLMIFFAIIYPLEKENEIKNKINEYNLEVEVSEMKIKNLIQDINVSIKETDEKKLNDKQNSKEREKEIEKQLLKNGKQIVESRENEIESLKIKYKKKSIDTLQIALDEFNIYKLFFLIAGSILSVFGFISWLIQTKKASRFTNN